MTTASRVSAAARPAPAPPRPYQFPTFERLTLTNGLGLVVAPVRKLPVVTVTAVAEAGAVSEPSGQEGIAHLTARALLEGTAHLDGAELAERFERLGASIESGASWDSATVSMTVLSSRLAPAMELFGQVLAEPAFPEREVERLKAERLAEVLQLRTEPRGLADEMFARFLYEARSRYAEPQDGGAATVSALTRDDVDAFRRARYRPGGMTLVVVGDVSIGDAHSLTERVFGSLPPGDPGVASALDQPARLARAVHIVTKPDAPQSELRMGHVGLPRTHSDYFRVLVMNAILGGLFSSRINLNLREAHGYTYGAYSGIDWRRGAGPFVVSSAVKSDVTALAAREVLAEIDRMRAEPVTAEELSLATSYLAGVFPIKYETTSAIALALAALVVYGLPADYFDTYRANVLAVTATDVLEAAERHLNPEVLQLLVVGEPEAVRGPLEGLAFGPVTVYDADGEPK